MPLRITTSDQPGEVYCLREQHATTGEVLDAWDTNSRTIGLQNGQSIAQANLSPGTDKSTLLFALRSPPATVFTLALTRLIIATPSAPVVPIVFELLAGHGRAASRVLQAAYTPGQYPPAGEETWLFQYGSRLATHWWLFAYQLPPQGPGTASTMQLSFRSLLTRQTPAALQLGPDVAVVP